VENRFQFQDFIKAFALSILLYAGLTGLFAVVPQASQIIEGFPPIFSFIIQYLLQFVLLFFPLWIFVVNKYSATLEDFGFRPVSWKTVLKTITACYSFYLIVSFSIATLLSALDLRIPGYETQNSYLPLFGTDLVGILIGFIFITIVAPFLEELLFRGFIYRVFLKTWPPALASFLTALLFALVHLQLQSFFPLFLLGLLLNYSYKKTDSVWTAVAFHSLNNLIAFSVSIALTVHPEWLKALAEATAFLYTVKIF